MPVLGDLPSTAVPSGENLPNPVILPDMQFSKDNFNAAMEAEKADAPPQVPETPLPSSPDFPPATEPKPESKPESKPEAETIPEKGTTDDKTVETPTEPTPAARANLPEELITGKKPEPKSDDALTEIDAMVLPKNAKPEQVASFSKLKAEAKRIIEERTARITELETKSGDGATKAEIQSAQERVKQAEERAKELESTIERIAFTESPRFKQFINDEQATLTNAKAYFEGTEINPEIVEYAARVNGQQRIKILREAGADAELIGAVSPYLAQFDNIQRYKNGAMENWKAGQAQYEEQVKAQQDAEVQLRRKSEDEVWNSVSGKLRTEIAAFQKFDKNDAWNERADKLFNEAKMEFNGEEGVPMDKLSETFLKGKAYDVEHEIRMAVTEELNRVLGENAKLKSARPGASNGQAPTGISNNANLSPEDQAKARFNSALAAARGG